MNGRRTGALLGLALALSTQRPLLSQDRAAAVAEMKVLLQDVFYNGPVTHWIANTGQTPIHNLIVELRDGTT